ncbi:MAG TPA: BamA/TamA family outer membrane protein [Gemmatimonadaceae bacterium]|nr:BamA/TamA family outer membrane protein [Gemmatimonadaceae bacterium]
MTTRRWWGLALCALAALAPLPLRAQQYFGKNQVQYDNFRWRIIETEHFDVYYYPAEHEAAMDAARMAERAYARLSRLFDHEFSEKKPIMLFASEADFAQNNVTGDLGEGVGGVTEPFRRRLLLPFTGDYKSFEQVLTHEMVHEFQFDIFAGGHGSGIGSLAAVNPPLWFTEGMAEYLSIGPHDPNTATVIRDAALNGHLPTMKEMTDEPDKYFPYRYGESLWRYVGKRWGDAVIGDIMNDVPGMGLEHAFQRELGVSLDDLGEEWRDAMQVEHLPQIAHLERPRTFAKPLLTKRRSGGQIFLAPALSSDGKYIAFLSNGSFLRGQVFIDLWLADAQTGKRIKRLVKSTFNPNFEELRVLYSQSAFSPDGTRLAFTAQRKGKDVLYLLDVATRKTIRRFDLPLEGVTSPSWSPDGSQLVFSGSKGGITDLYIVNADGTHLRRLTHDRYGDLQPQWSPDGKTIAFASDRGPTTDFSVLRLGELRIALYHLADGRIDVLPGQDGTNINPMWAPDGHSIAYISTRTGIQNVFLYDLNTRQHYQLTNVVGGVTAITKSSPAITWARQADRLAFTYYEDGKYTVWTVDHPRRLERAPFRTDSTPAALVASAGEVRIQGASPRAPGARTAQTNDSVSGRAARPSSDTTSADSVPPFDYVLPPTKWRAAPDSASGKPSHRVSPTVSVQALLDSAALALPDTTTFTDRPYHVHYSPDFVAQPSVGYTSNNFGRGVYGGTAIVLSDLVGNNHLTFAGAVNGRLSEAQVFAGYTSLAHRLQYSVGIYQQPYYFAQGTQVGEDASGQPIQRAILSRYIERQAFGVAVYPMNRFTRVELGMQLSNLDRADLILTAHVDATGYPISEDQEEVDGRTKNYISPYLAYVSDNVLWGVTAPIMGRRYRLQVQPSAGDFQWVSYLADYRRYDPILFNYLTIATRVFADIPVGRDADSLVKSIGYSDLLPGYDDRTFRSSEASCPFTTQQSFYRCSPVLGSRIMLASAEVRFPLLRGAGLGGILSLPAIDGAFFYNAGVTWFGGQDVSFSRHSRTRTGGAGFTTTRSLLTSYGFGLRINLFNYAILRWDYAIPLDAPNRKGVWQFSLYPPF